MRGSSIKLGEIFGIRIGVDRSWFIVLFLVIWILNGYFRDSMPNSDSTLSFVLATAAALLFFVSIVLHELGHSFVAIRNKIPIAGIDLWMFGGVARMTRDTDSPGVEFRVAIAGPIVTLLIAALCAAIGTLVVGWQNFADAMVFRPGNVDNGGVALLACLASINMTVFIFNLIPAFPLDGGRVARAIAWKITGNRSAATRFAARLGRILAYVLIGIGVVSAAMGDLIGGIWLAFLGFFLSQAAKGAEYQDKITSRIEGVTVADVMERQPVDLREEISAEDALDGYFLRYHYPWFPVTDALGHFVGFLERGQVDSLTSDAFETASVKDLMTPRGEIDVGIPESEQLEVVLGNEQLYKLGALVALNESGQVSGVVTVENIRRALKLGST